MLCCIDAHQCSCKFASQTPIHMYALKYSHTLSLEVVLILLSSNSMYHDVDFRNFNITSIFKNTYLHICFVLQCFAISKVIHHNWCCCCGIRRRCRHKYMIYNGFYIFALTLNQLNCPSNGFIITISNWPHSIHIEQLKSLDM